MINVPESLEWLGWKVVDIITGVRGVVTSVAFDITGCAQGLVTPPIVKDQKEKPESYWVDVQRLKKTSKSKVIDRQRFVYEEGSGDRFKAGAVDKPIP